jgi:hypothetical protein
MDRVQFEVGKIKVTFDGRVFCEDSFVGELSSDYVRGKISGEFLHLKKIQKSLNKEIKHFKAFISAFSDFDD